MSKKKRYVFYIAGAVLIVATLLAGLFMEILWMNDNTSIIGEYLRCFAAAIATVWLGLFTNEAIRNSGMVNENSRILKDMGITEVSSVGSTDSDIDNLFKTCKTVKICVITGPGFLKTHKKAIEFALLHGTTIQMLMAKEGSVFLSETTEQLRAIAHLKDGNLLDVDQENEIQEVKAIIAQWNEQIKIWKKEEREDLGSIEVRQYNTEFRTKFILGFSKDEKKNKGKIYGYYNLALPVRAPSEYPLFIGMVNEHMREKYVQIEIEKNGDVTQRNRKRPHFIFDLDLHFNYIWNKYAPKAKA